ncbi:MAG: hypothetical protein JEZ06_12090 [Anaerolineaceae bacterium]|nr:hypothetical protein [Anaerolineaceae bacterium]
MFILLMAHLYLHLWQSIETPPLGRLLCIRQGLQTRFVSDCRYEMGRVGRNFAFVEVHLVINNEIFQTIDLMKVGSSS